MYFCIIIAVFFIVYHFSLKNEKLTIAEKKGIEGEEKVKKLLSSLPKEYIVLNDILLKYKDITTQIDHIVVCKKGVFVIETKNYSGKIYGDDYRKYWTQKVNRRKNTFYSPVWQNKTHVNAVKSLLKNFSYVPVYSVITFCGQCNIKKVKSNYGVVYMKKLKKYIKRYKSETNLKKDEISNIYHILIHNNIHSRRVRYKHVKKIKKEYI